MIIDLDPPEHTRLRTLVARAFTPRAVKSLDGHYREVAADLIGTILAKDEIDFVTEVAAELPLIAIAELMGVPVEERHNLFEWSNSMVGAADPEYQKGMAPDSAMMELYAYAQKLAAERRLDPATTSSRRCSPPKTATRCPTTSSTSSSCCCRWRATRRPATRSATASTPSSSTPTSGPACAPTRSCSTPRWRRSCAGARP